MSLFADDMREMPVQSDMLTPQGMRQRYLKGRYNRSRYIEQYGLLSAEFTPGEIYVQSTNFERT